MSDILKLGNTNISVLKDPFKKNKIIRVSVNFSENEFREGNWKARGYVDFKNGNTQGQQKFEGETFENVVLQIKTFIDNIE